jgi:hypothetical protein
MNHTVGYGLGFSIQFFNVIILVSFFSCQCQATRLGDPVDEQLGGTPSSAKEDKIAPQGKETHL